MFHWSSFYPVRHWPPTRTNKGTFFLIYLHIFLSQAPSHHSHLGNLLKLFLEPLPASLPFIHLLLLCKTSSVFPILHPLFPPLNTHARCSSVSIVHLAIVIAQLYCSNQLSSYSALLLHTSPLKTKPKVAYLAGLTSLQLDVIYEEVITRKCNNYNCVQLVKQGLTWHSKHIHIGEMMWSSSQNY